jgi:hypothetical protein
MSGHHHAALALYRLGAADQDLILAELPDSDQARLRGYLAELAELGFDQTVPAPPPPQVFSPVVHTPASAHEQLRIAPAAAVAALLAGEPPGLVAQLLAGDSWPWQDELLALLEPARRTQVQRALEARRGQGAPACTALLVEAMAPRLAASVSAAAPAVQKLRARMSLLFGKVRAWTR